jgi:hypothetical protein
MRPLVTFLAWQPLPPLAAQTLAACHPPLRSDRARGEIAKQKCYLYFYQWYRLTARRARLG